MACKQLRSLQNLNNLKNSLISKLHLKFSSHHAKPLSSTFYFENLSDTYIFPGDKLPFLGSISTITKAQQSPIYSAQFNNHRLAGPRSPTHPQVRDPNCSVAPLRLPAPGSRRRRPHRRFSSTHTAPRYRPQASPARSKPQPSPGPQRRHAQAAASCCRPALSGDSPQNRRSVAGWRQLICFPAIPGSLERRCRMTSRDQKLCTSDVAAGRSLLLSVTSHRAARCPDSR